MIRYRPDLIDQLDPVSESGLAPRRAVHVPAFVTGHHQQQRSGRLQGQFVHTPGPGSSPQRGESRLDDVLGGRPRRRTAEREVVDRVTVPVEEIGQGMLIGGSEPVPQVTVAADRSAVSHPWSHPFAPPASLFVCSYLGESGCSTSGSVIPSAARAAVGHAAHVPTTPP
jgi:hypothetical protein